MKSNRKLSEERSFPSTLMERGTSGRTLTAAFRKASAGGGGERDGEREEGREVTRKKGGSQGKERGKITMLGTAETKQTELTIVSSCVAGIFTPGLKSERKQLLTLGKTLVRQRNLTRQQVEAETAEDAAERRDGDETVGGARLGESERQQRDRQLCSECNIRVSRNLFL